MHDQSTTASTYALGTVFFNGDVDLLRFHALSIQRNSLQTEISEIHLAWNDPAPLTQDIKDTILQAYGDALSDRVRFHTRASLGANVGEMSGWRSQQVLKLLLGNEVSDTCFVLMDTKNLFVSPVTKASFFTTDGMPISYLSTKSEQQKSWARHSRAFFDMPPMRHDDPDGPILLPPTITPYPIRTADLQGTVSAIEEKEGAVDRLFAREAFGGSEFFLIYAYLISDGSDIRDHFDMSGARIPTLFAKWPEDEPTAIKVCREALDGKSPFFAIHPRRKGRISSGVAEVAREIWTRAGLPAAELETYYEIHD